MEETIQVLWSEKNAVIVINDFDLDEGEDGINIDAKLYELTEEGIFEYTQEELETYLSNFFESAIQNAINNMGIENGKDTKES